LSRTVGGWYDAAPMKLVYVDATAGASGDMLLGALVDAGVPLSVFREAVRAVGLRRVKLSSRRIVRGGLAARKVRVSVPERGAQRSFAEVRSILARARLAPDVRQRALAIFRRLFEAEAEAHGRRLDSIHLHEAGALDAIVDVVGAVSGFDHLGADRIIVSPLTTGYGTVASEHGLLPVPGPATTRLLVGAPLSGEEAPGERLTPTGAAILTTLAERFGAPPPMRLLRTGHGAGDRDFPDRPNVLRLLVGEPIEDRRFGGAAEVLVIEFTVDDATPQLLAYAAERLFRAGALEVYTTPVYMKKGRAGHQVTVLCRPEDGKTLCRVALEETSTFGLRYRIEGRVELERNLQRVSTPYGPIRIKVGRSDGQALHAWPEYEDCAAAARRHGVSLQEVQLAALASHRARPRRDLR